MTLTDALTNHSLASVATTDTYSDATASSYPGMKPGEVSSGTTIIALTCQDGVILGADGRVATGSYVVHRTSDKIAALSSHIFACRSGSAADTQALTEYVRFYLQQLEIETGRPPRVKTAAHLLARLQYNNKDNLSAGMIVAGWDPVDGGTVYLLPQGGSKIGVPFALGGSGSTYIYGLVDAQFRPDMTVAEARTLVKQAVAHAIARDGGSGGIIRTIAVTAEGPDRDYTPGNQLPFGPTGY